MLQEHVYGKEDACRSRMRELCYIKNRWIRRYREKRGQVRTSQQRLSQDCDTVEVVANPGTTHEPAQKLCNDMLHMCLCGKECVHVSGGSVLILGLWVVETAALACVRRPLVGYSNVNSVSQTVNTNRPHYLDCLTVDRPGSRQEAGI